MKPFTFFWSPEGRPLVIVHAIDIKEARGEFRRQFPQHAKYMGEVYVEPGAHHGRIY